MSTSSLSVAAAPATVPSAPLVLAMAAADWPLAAVLATVAGLYVLSFTDLEWRGLIGWGLLLLGLAFHIVRFGLKPPSDPDRRR